MNVSEYIARFWRESAPQAAVSLSDEGVEVSLWDGKEWQTVDALPQASPLARTVLLVPEDDVYFRLRMFPADLAGKDALDEAVELDAEAWAPWGNDSEFFYWPVLSGDQWQVAVWAWNKARLTDQLPAHISVTHIMPRSVWRIAGIRGLGSSSLIVWPFGNQFAYVWVDKNSMPLHIATVCDQADAMRFWRSLGVQEADATAVFLCDSLSPEDTPWLPAAPIAEVENKMPGAAIFKQAVLPGRQDWSDPLAWRKPIMALVILCLLWLGGSSAILWNRDMDVESALRETRASAESVLALRDRVLHLRDRLEAIGALRHRQERELRFLEQLSDQLPDDAWLLAVVFEGAWVNIEGRAKDAVEIGVRLESIPGIDHVAYRGDIRPDAASGREIFNMRLHFKADEG